MKISRSDVFAIDPDDLDDDEDEDDEAELRWQAGLDFIRELAEPQVEGDDDDD